MFSHTTPLHRPARPGDSVIPDAGEYWVPTCAGTTILLWASVRRLFAEQRHFAGDRSTLTLEVIGHGAAERRVSDPMDAVGRHRQIAAGDLVRSLGAGLNPGKLVLNSEIDGLVVADLEME